jgi:hypothetical protein
MVSRRLVLVEPVNRSLTAILRLPAMRRAIAAVCAVAFLFVGFAHSLHHFDATTPAVLYQAAASSGDTSLDSTEKAAPAVHHCHGCVMVAIAAPGQPAAAIPLSPNRVAGGFDSVRQHPPLAEKPPPKTTI